MTNDKRRPDARPMAVDLQQLRFAVSAADIGSFRQAADVLRLSQSRLSRCVRKLEHSIGVVVFERSSGGVKPTPGGREFLRQTAKTTWRGETGKLAVGFLHVSFDGKSACSAARFQGTLSTYRTRHRRTIANALDDCATKRNTRHSRRDRRYASSRKSDPSALERADPGRLARGSSLDDA